MSSQVDHKADLAANTPTPANFWRTAQTNARLRQQRPIQAQSHDGKPPLSLHQERLWFFEQMQPDKTVHNLLHLIYLQGSLDCEALEQSLTAIAQRHEVLRSAFSSHGQPAQVIVPELNWSLPCIDLCHLPETQRQAEAYRLALVDAEQPFDLSCPPLWRFQLMQLGEQEYVLSRTIHHILFDGWSHGVFMRELGAFYQAFASNSPVKLLPLPIQYGDFAAAQRQWLAGEDFPEHLAYWQQKLGSQPTPLQLPIDQPRPLTPTYQGGCQQFTLSETLTRDLKALSFRQEVSLFTVLLTSFKVLLQRYSGQEDLMLCSPVASRHRNEVRGLIGYFNNLIVLRTDASGNPSFREFLGRVSQVTLEAQEHQEVPFQKLAELPELAHHPLTRAVFILQNAPAQNLKLKDLTITSDFIEREVADFDLALSMQEQGNRLVGTLQYRASLFQAETIDRLLTNLEEVMALVVEDVDRPLNQFPQFESAHLDLPRERSLHRAAFVAAKNQTEAQLVSLWQTLLGLEQIGTQDHFFDLGGSSLLAVQLFAQIEQLFATVLPLSTIMTAPTISQLAAILRQEATDQGQGGVVLLRAGGSGAPLFLIHDGYGEILLYRNLANLLRSDRPIYGILPYRQEDCPILHTRVPDMAAYCIEQIRTVQPEGPYLIAGLCAGGVLSFEIARQLQALGQTVPLLVIMDAADVAATMRTGHIAGQRLTRFKAALQSLLKPAGNPAPQPAALGSESAPAPLSPPPGTHRRSPTGLLQKLFRLVLLVSRKGFNLIRYEVQQRVEVWRDQVLLTLFRYCTDRQLAIPTFLKHLSVMRVFAFAMQDYVPASQFKGEIVLLRATQEDRTVAGENIFDEPYQNRYSDPLLGWGRRVTGGITVYDMPGGHSSMLQYPYVPVIAKRVQACLDQALSAELKPRSTELTSHAIDNFKN